MSGITVLGNLAVDRVNGADPSPGGCPTFAAAALEALGRSGRIVTRAARADLPLFRSLLESTVVPVTVLPTSTTSAFGLLYSGERRRLTVDAVAVPWSSSEIEGAAIDTAWIHIAPLLRTDFPLPTLVELSAGGHRISYDGQGLVRPGRLGPLEMDADYDPDLLRTLTVLKLSDEELEILVAGRFDAKAAVRLGVPEILVTRGSDGCDVFVGGELVHVPAARRILDVQSTGAGDTFMVVYAADRAEEVDPVDAARHASEVVAEMLERRRNATP